MSTVIRRNERSWAIDLISDINTMLSTLGLLIKKAGGESTISIERKSMFPDVLLYGDNTQTKILQGWELKLPDTSITDVSFISDATRKANALGLNSFFIWNFSAGVLYAKSTSGNFEPIKTWNDTNFIKTRDDVKAYKEKWQPVIKDVILSINDYFETGTFRSSNLGQVVSDNLLLEVIKRNQKVLATHIKQQAIKDSVINSFVSVWWEEVKFEYVADEPDMYNAYSKIIILRWLNRITFAHLIKKYYGIARKIDDISFDSTPSQANDIFNEITCECDFYNVFSPVEYDYLLDQDTWYDLIDVSLFLKTNGLLGVEHTDLQDILENTVISSKREVRGQFTTPPTLAYLLAKITVKDWTAPCIDPCCGTGSIIKEILNEKISLIGTEKAYETTWASDKYSFPLQISNISLVRADAMNFPCRLFQNNVFELNCGKIISITNPQTGDDMQINLPKFSAIASNLPFVPFEKITTDEITYIKTLNQKVNNVSGEALDGRGDLYSYIIFSLWNILEDGGKLGVILSNSWLGTDWGSKFLEQLFSYYKIKNIIISGSGRWFKNADVVTTILLLEKKDIDSQTSTVTFSVLAKSLDELSQTPEMMTNAINSIILEKEIDSSIVCCKKYTFDVIKELLGLGISKNALFHNVNWLKEIKDKLIPITDLFKISRGERRGQNKLFYPEVNHGIEKEYLKPILKNPKNLKSLNAETDIEAFCCSKTIEELNELGHYGAVNWIKKFENVSTVRKGKIVKISEVLKAKGKQWYEMSDDRKVDFVTAINPDKRLFVGKFDKPTFTDQRFTCFKVKNSMVDTQLCHALLNSLLGMFYIESIGFGRGLGVLDTSSDNFQKVYMLSPALLNAEQKRKIVEKFAPILNRKVFKVVEELEKTDRVDFDLTVLNAFGIEEHYESIKKSLLSMQKSRQSANIK